MTEISFVFGTNYATRMFEVPTSDHRFREIGDSNVRDVRVRVSRKIALAANVWFGEAAMRRGLTQRMTGLGRSQFIGFWAIRVKNCPNLQQWQTHRRKDCASPGALFHVFLLHPCERENGSGPTA